MNQIPYGHCQCGCGNKTNTSKQNHKKFGWVKGLPRSYLRGHNQKNIVNLSRERQRYRWAKQRCINLNNPSYQYYGERGIKFRFSNFDEFYNELGSCPKGMTLERIDVDKHYEIGNVRWATYTEQARNRRKFTGIADDTSSKYKGVSWNKGISKWQVYIGLNYKRIYLGSYNNELDAAAAYNRAATKHFKEAAVINKLPQN